MEKPAICGGTPVRSTPLAYGHQYIDDEDIRAVTETLQSECLTCGPRTRELESMLCRITGAKYCVAVSNGTAALHIAALAAGIGPGGEGITSPITFAASANCALYCGAKPVFADIRPDTYNIDPASIRACITPRTKAVVAVDFTGQAVELDEIRAICREHRLTLIEDAAHSIGTRYKGQPIGSLADMTTFSFHPVKTVTAGEGGAVTTDSRELYDKLVLLHAHGITRDRSQMVHPTDDPWYNEQAAFGFNYRMTEIQAALLLSQLNKLERFSRRRKEIVARYDAAFSRIPQLQVQREIPASDTTRHLYILRLRSEMLRCTRREFFDALGAEGIHSQVHYLPVYWHSYYESLGYEKGLCPQAERYYREAMSLPLYYSLTDRDVEDVIHIVEKLINYYAK